MFTVNTCQNFIAYVTTFNNNRLLGALAQYLRYSNADPIKTTITSESNGWNPKTDVRTD
jgi:hypothetical protein